MKKRDRWVIDADIARSAGESEHPVSDLSRKFLEYVLESGAKFVFNPKLLNEWYKHRSKYSYGWLKSMTARKRLVKAKDGYSFETKIDRSDILSEKDKEAAKKDCHLIDASFNNGKTIASNERVAREIYCRLSGRNGELGDILWVTPREDAERIICFSKQGKKADPEWYINISRSA